jgi:phosphoserine phosphatase
VIPRALRDAVRRAAASSGVAAFDADGTLWREDVGEAFLRHLVAIGWVRLPDGSDPYRAYERAVDRDKRTGYAYAAQLQEGLLAAEVAAEAERFARSWVPPRLVRAAQELCAACADAGLKTVAISASPLPIVRAAAPLAGIAEHAAIEVRIQAGRFTCEVLEPIPYAEGKVQAAAKFGPLIVACGDSLPGDLPLLSAARVAAVVAPSTGSPLSLEANRRGWPILNRD